jgi:23S rRNA (adenine2030-N6)-methyltransferase
MNYRHVYHAGNFADVLKHTAFVAVLHHLRKKETPFAVIDAHGGRGLYDLDSEEAKKTGEAKDGIGRLLAADSAPGVLEDYCRIVQGFGPSSYPGSPLFAAKLMRRQDRLVAIEKHPDEFAALAAALKTTKRARVVEGDYRQQLKSLLPPPERRGVVLVDPPYEAEDEFSEAAQALIEAYRRFATGIYLFWYPMKDRTSLNAVRGELLNAGIGSLLEIELDIGTKAARDEGRSPPLSATGLLVVNPPYKFEDEMAEALPFLAKLLAQGPDSHFGLRWLPKEQ